jgi:DNA-binding NarL/FixJ family response regulator
LAYIAEVEVKILIADDDFLVLRSLKRILRKNQLLFAPDVSSAIGLAAKHQPDVIIVDVCFPGTSGLGTIALLREHHPRAILMVITGLLGPEIAIEAYSLGADSFVPKIDLALVPEILSRLLDERARGGS